ncbi:MAG TPA: adenylate/guanylate cyclase domain-containing protein [Thermoanaerobaculia bacterium]
MHPDLAALLDRRLGSGADVAAIDAEVWQRFGTRLAMLVTDLSGFSRAVAERGIVHVLQTIYESERLLVPIAQTHRGTLVKIEGDSFLVIFAEASDAVSTALHMQRATAEYNATRPADARVLLGCGIGFGEVLRVGEADVFGTEVNAAYILGEDTARAGEILVTRAVRDALPQLDCEPVADSPPGTGGAFRIRSGPR